MTQDTTNALRDEAERLRNLAGVIRKYGTCPPLALEDAADRIAALAPAAQVDSVLTAAEIEWLEYAVAHMQDDNEPEDAECATVLQSLLDRAALAQTGREA